MRIPSSAGRIRLSLKASHRRFTLRTSHRVEPTQVERVPERERYIAPPKRRR
jgi:hypothetical protein